MSARYERARIAAQRKLDADVSPITKSEPTDSALAADLAPYDSEDQKAESTAKEIQAQTLPEVAAGKASAQALGSRQQILDDNAGGGLAVLKEEAAEEREAQRMLRRSPRKKSLASTPSAGLKGLRDRVNTSLHGKGSGVLGVESH